jgi:hypothetical protein
MRSEIVIAISQNDREPWKRIRKSQVETWIKKFNQDAKIIHYFSKNPPFMIKFLDALIEKYRFNKKTGKIISILNRLISKIISSKIPNYHFNVKKEELLVSSYSTYFLFGRRNLALYDWFIKETDAKFLFQTNTSSYVDVNKLNQIAAKLDCTNLIFAGVINNPNSKNFKIISGAGRLLSRDLIVAILENKHKLKFDNLEDICISEVISKLSSKIVPLERYDLNSMEKLHETSDEVLQRYFHFRCKSDTLPRIDDAIMISLHKRLSDS